MNRTSSSILVVVAIAGPAAIASADIVTATFAFDHNVRTTIASVPMSGDVSAVDFRWTRTDSPGPGVDATLASQFISFCVELDQRVRAGTTYTYDVLTPAQAGYSPQQEAALQMLWAEHIDEADTAAGSAAFQLAVWELRYDNNHDLATGAFRASSPSASLAMAQTWLSGLGSDSTLRTLPALAVLRNDDSQDQLTALIPEPGAIACALAGLGLLRRRRRR